MQLNGVQAERNSKVLQILWIGMIHKNSHNRHEWRQLLNDFCRARRLNVSRAARIKIQSDRIRAQQRSKEEQGGKSHAAA